MKTTILYSFPWALFKTNKQTHRYLLYKLVVSSSLLGELKRTALPENPWLSTLPYFAWWYSKNSLSLLKGFFKYTWKEKKNSSTLSYQGIDSSYLQQHFQLSSLKKHGKQPKPANMGTFPLRTGNPTSGWEGSHFPDVVTKELNICALTTLPYLKGQVQA